MSMTAVIPYFRTHMNALGFREWRDSFNFDNIPKNIINKSYHIEISSVSGIVLNQHVQEAVASITVRLFLKGYKDTTTRRETGISYCEDILKRMCDPDNRTTGTVKNVKFDSMTVLPIDPTNDNIMMFEVNFTGLIFVDVDA